MVAATKSENRSNCHHLPAPYNVENIGNLDPDKRSDDSLIIKMPNTLHDRIRRNLNHREAPMFSTPKLRSSILGGGIALILFSVNAAAQQPMAPPSVQQPNWVDELGNCTCGCCRKPKKICRLPGFRGTPYEDPKDNGCKCNRKCQNKLHPNFSAYWPRPLANKEIYGPPDAPVPCRPRDRLDRLANLKLSNFKRKHTGYSGLYCDPFGKLGESCTRPAPEIERAQLPPMKTYK
jgi:hypothetical protein